MKVKHRGHTIEVEREKAMGGWSMLFWSIFRDSDGLECDSGFSDSDETVRELAGQLRERVDAELATEDPWLEREGFF